VKIEIGTKEIIDFLNGGDASALKEKLSGAILAMADSQEMEDAVKGRVGTRIQEALDTAFRLEKDWPNGHRIKGWAADTVKTWLTTQMGNLSVESIIRDETRKALAENQEKVVQSVIKEINRQEVIAAVSTAFVERNIALQIEEQVKAAVSKIIKL
jgi:hypothetical protein